MARHKMFSSLPQKRRRTPRPLDGGLNNGLTPFAIQDNEATDQLNIQARFYPSIRPRFPRTNVGTVLGAPTFLGSRAKDYLLSADGTNLYKFEGGVWTSVGAITSSNDADVVDFQGTTLFANRVDMKQFDGATLADITDMPATDLLATHSGRVYAASTVNDSLYFSAIADPLDWTSANNAGEIVIATKNNKSCTGLVAFNNHIVYFKEDSMHELYGTKPDNYQIQTISEETGCINPRAVHEIDGILFFVGFDGVYMYGGGTAPDKISYPYIDDYFKNLDRANLSKCKAGHFGEVLYIILPINSGETIMLSYDTNTAKWSAEDEIEYEEMETFEEVLYGITPAGQLVNVVDEDGSEAVSWFTITKAFDEGMISGYKVIDRIYLSLYIPTGSNVSVELSATSDGETFTTMEIFTATSGDEVKEVIVPHTLKDIERWHRIRLSGTGDCTIYNMEVQSRLIENTF